MKINNDFLVKFLQELRDEKTVKQKKEEDAKTIQKNIEDWNNLNNGLNNVPNDSLAKTICDNIDQTLNGDSNVDTLTDEIKFMQNTFQFIGQSLRSVEAFVKAYTPYNQQPQLYKNIVDKVITDNFLDSDYAKFTKTELISAMKKAGYNITARMTAVAVTASLNNIPTSSILDTFMQGINASEGRKNTTIVSSNQKINNNIVPVSVKKITNMVLSLLHYAHILNNNNFKGSNLNENNTLKDLYEDIADKMYIITSLNKSNTQLQKLDKDFGKLYKLVTTGIRLFKLPSTSGGSIHGGKLNIPSKYLYTPKKPPFTNYPHLL